MNSYLIQIIFKEIWFIDGTLTCIPTSFRINANKGIFPTFQIQFRFKSGLLLFGPEYWRRILNPADNILV